jgi:hypothetical protein
MRWGALTVVAAAAALLATASGRADENLTHFGAWTVLTSEPSVGHTITQISSKEGPVEVELFCASGPWSLFVSDSSGGDASDTTTSVSMTYAFDRGAVRHVSGRGKPRYRFDLDRSANAFVGELVRAHATFSFAIEPDKQMKTVRIAEASKAVASSLSRCPIPDK